MHEINLTSFESSVIVLFVTGQRKTMSEIQFEMLMSMLSKDARCIADIVLGNPSDDTKECHKVIANKFNTWAARILEIKNGRW